jgi:chemotaxis signal transduction protein
MTITRRPTIKLPMTTGDQHEMINHDGGRATTARALFVVRAGTQLFALFAEEVEATARDLTPTPLPFAPPAVVGVVSLRGRILTVIDPLRLDDAGHADQTAEGFEDQSSRLFIALAGDEQLALVCDAAEETFTVEPSRIKPPHDPRSHARGAIKRGGARVTLLDPQPPAFFPLRARMLRLIRERTSLWSTRIRRVARARAARRADGRGPRARR